MKVLRNVVLMGFMGTGKSTVGQELSCLSGMSLLDTDALIEARAGKPITRIFAEDGEPAFRAMEHAMAVELAAKPGHVIATGGGMVLNAENIRVFAQSGLVVCLRADVEEILQRLAGDTTRPLLSAPDRRERIEALLSARQPLYAAVPFQVETAGRSPAEIAGEIWRLYHAQ